jgi:hypothetical protein
MSGTLNNIIETEFEEDELEKYYFLKSQETRPSVMWLENGVVQQVFICDDQISAEQFAIDLGKHLGIFSGNNYDNFIEEQMDNGGCINGIEIYVENSTYVGKMSASEFFHNLKNKF